MENGEIESISISEFLRYLARQWVFMLAVAVAASSLAVIYTRLQPAKYESAAQVVVLGDSRQQGISHDIVLGNYVALLTSNLVLDQVQQETGISITELRQNITPSREKTSEIITISYASGEPDKAASVIDSTISSFSEAVTKMYGLPEDGVSVVSPAIDSGIATNRNIATPVVMSAAGALTVLLIVTFLRFDSKTYKTTTADKIAVDEVTEKIHRQKLVAELKLAKLNAATELKAAKIRARKLVKAEKSTKIAPLAPTITPAHPYFLSQRPIGEMA